MEESFEARKLSSHYLDRLAEILEDNDSWERLLSIVPTVLKKGEFECGINPPNNLPQYKVGHVTIIENFAKATKTLRARVFLDEWLCTGRVRPALGHLLHLLKEAHLYRAAKYVAVDILGQQPPARPTTGPAALVKLDEEEFKKIQDIRDEELKQLLNGFKDPLSSDLDNRTLSTIECNIDRTKNLNLQSIPKIVISESSDSLPIAPIIVVSSVDNNEQEENENNNQELETSEMPQFSALISETQVDTIIDTEDVSDSFVSSDVSDNISEQIPNLTELIDSNGKKVKDTTQSSFVIPAVLDQDSGFQIAVSEGLPNLSELGNNLSEGIKSGDADAVLNSSELPNLTEFNLEFSQESITLGTSPKSEQHNLPNFSELIGNVSDSTTLNSVKSAFIPNLSVLISNSNSNNTSKRSCVSPLPSLSLNTDLCHFEYHKLEKATNDFNNNEFVDFNHPGRLLGSGAFGSVYIAQDLLDEKEKNVAVKKILIGNADMINVTDAVTIQFRNEVEILSKYKHPNLLSLLGYSCDGCTYCLLYEYISGGTLKERLQIKDEKQKLLWTERVTIAVQTSEAISYLHTAFTTPLIHRDIKSANILLDCSNKPKLGDFGLIKLMQPNADNNSTTQVLGSVAYMAPEVGRGDISLKLDTFSFGVVLLELLTSLPPLDASRDGNDLVTEVETICEDSIRPLLDTTVGSWTVGDRDVADELYDIAIRCLEGKKKRPVMVDVTSLLNKLATF